MGRPGEVARAAGSPSRRGVPIMPAPPRDAADVTTRVDI